MLGRGPRESGVRGVNYFISSSNLACFLHLCKGDLLIEGLIGGPGILIFFFRDFGF
ncbi:hypothetical protein RchiOBHm_Chr7g0217511 [Rosa chinensis]|uniref:Uncharacterized protein n=1 Tax=Rosa chinensis TaxID=74649 RepID=A0A2P6PC14_ROSCH|nr:hypothetical protein RchiOBHm_Chr7g0217511 [Rosa chinensis]